MNDIILNRSYGLPSQQFMLDANLADSVNASSLCRQLLAGAAMPAMFAVDPADHKLLLCSASACALLGIDSQAASTAELSSIIPALTSGRLNLIWREVLASGQATLDAELSSAYGGRIAVAIAFSVLPLDGQTLLAACLSDISERRALQAECRRLSDEIAGREVELRYREIYENVTDGIMLLDVYDLGRFRYAGINPAMARMTGLLRHDILGQFVEDVLPADAAAALVALYRRCVSEAKPVEAEVELALPAGKRFLELNLIPVRDASGGIRRLIGLSRDITERRLAEREIGFMNFSLDQMQDAVFLIDSQLRFRYVNDRACLSLGYSREELLTMNVPDIDPDVDMDVAQVEAFRAKMQEQGYQRFETIHRAKDGHCFPVEINVTRFEYGGEMMDLAVARDISERRQYEDSLRKRQQQLSEAQRIARLGSWELDLISGVLSWSDEIFRIFEIDPARFGASYQAFIGAVHPEDREAVDRAYSESLKKRTPYEIEHRLLMADGRVKYVLERGETRYAMDGKPLSSLGTVQDITERKHLEQALQQREHEFRTLVQNMPGILARYDADCRFVYVNPSFERMFDVTLEQVRGKTNSEVPGLPEAGFFEAKVRQALLSGEDEVFEHSVPSADGSTSHGLVHITPERDADGKVIYVQVVTRDISERKRAEEQLQQSLAFSEGVINAIPDLLFEMDGDGRYHNVWTHQPELLAAQREVLIGKTVHDVLSPEAAEIAMAAFRKAEEAGSSFGSVLAIDLPQGKCWFEFSISKKPGDAALGPRFIVLSRDVTERKQYEAALEARAELERRQSQYFAMAPGLFATILMTAEGGYAMPFASEGIRELYGLEPEAVMRDIGVLVAAAHPDDVEMTFRKAEESARNLTLYHVEYRINHPQKGERWIEVRSQPQALPDGSVRWDGFYHDITERKRMEAELVAQAEFQQTLLNAMYEVGLQLMVIENGRIVHIGNPNKLIRLGMTEEELAAHPPLIDIVHPDDRERVMDYHRRRQVGETVPTTYELGLVTRDGERLEYETSVVVVPNTDPVRTISIGRNIGERKRMEAELIRQAEFQQTLLNAMYDVGLQVMMVENGEIIHVGNRELARQLGYSDADLDRRVPLMDIVHPDDRARVSDYYRRRLAGEAVSSNYELGLVSRDGERREFEVAVAVVPNSDPVRIVTIGKDIGERKAAEKQINLLTASLDHVKDTVFLIGEDAGLLYANEGACHALGYSREELLGLRVADIDPDYQLDGGPDHWRELEAKGALAFESRHKTKDGRIFPVEIIANYVEFEGQAYNLAICRDVTEQKRIAGALDFVARRGWNSDGESFLTALARYLSEALVMDFVLIAKLADDPGHAETIAFLAKGEMLPAMRYELAHTPCESVMDGELRCYPAHVRQIFTEDKVLIESELDVESYVGLPLWDSSGQVIGLIAVMDSKPMPDTAAVASLMKLTAPRAAAELERGLHDKALSKQQQALTEAQRIARVGSWEFDHLRDRLSWSDEMFRIFEIAQEEGASYQDCFYRIHPGDRKAVERARHEALAAQMPYESEHRLLFPDGRIKYVHERSEAAFAPDGAPLHSLGMIQDITERKRVENTLSFIAQAGWQQDDESFQTALARYLGETLAVDYVVIDKLADAAGHAETIALYAKGRVLPNMQYALKATPCENVMEGKLCCYPSGVRQQFPEDILLVEMAVDSYAGLPLWDSKGQVIGLIAVMDAKPMSDVPTVTNILQLVATRAAAELEREQSERDLAESRLFLQQVIDTVADPIFVKDRQHRWLVLNQAMCRLMGRPPEALLGKSDYDFFPAEEADVFWAKDEEVFEGGGNVNEEAFTDAEGVLHTIVTSKTCFTDAKGDSILVGTIKDITGLKQIQRHLENTSNRLRSVLQTMPDYVWLKDPDGIYLACNHAFERLFGARETDILGKTDYDFVETGLADFFRQKDREAMDAGYMLINEEWVVLEDGSRTLLETRKVPVQGADGAVIGVLGIGRDITERKRMLDLLEQRERDFRSLAENLPDNIARWDAEGRILYNNPTNQRTVGKPASELIGKTFGEAFPDGRYAPIDMAVAQVIASGQPVLIERQLVPNESGGMDIHDISLVPEFDNAGRVVSVLGLGRDMTDIYRMQEAIVVRERELRSLTENLPDNIARWDREGRILFSNPTHQRTLGKPAAELIGKTHIEAFPDDRYRTVDMAIAQVVATGEPVSFVRQPVPAENGETRIHDIKLVAEFDETGQVIGVLGLGRDMTDLYRMQDAITAREQEFRSLAESSPNSIIRYDREGRILYHNSVLASTLGIADSNVIGMLPGEVWPDGRFMAVERAVVRAVETESDVSIEVCDFTVEGEFIAHQIHIVPERDVAGQVIGTIAFGWDITDLKRYAQSLLEQAKLEQQLSGVAASVPGFIFTIRTAPDRHVSFPFASTGIEELFGLRPEDIRDDAAVLRARYHPEDLPRILALMDETERTLSPFRIEIRIFHPDHGQRWIEIRSMPQRQPDGGTEWHGIMLDISERKHVERELALLNHAVNRSNDAIHLVDSRGRIAFANDAMCHRLGYNREELQKLKIPDIDPLVNEEMIVGMINQMSVDSMRSAFESLHRTRDGYVFPVEISTTLFEFDGEHFSLAVARDITERKRMEQTLAEREREFRTLVENLPTYVLRLDLNLRRVYVNPAYVGLVGVSEAELIGTHVSRYWRADNLSIAAYTKILRAVLILGEQQEITLEWNGDDQGFVSHLLRIAPEFGHDGEIQGLLILGFDISERRRQELLEVERQRVFERVAHGDDLDGILKQVALYVEASKAGRRCLILMFDEDGQRLQHVAAPSFPHVFLDNLHRLLSDGSTCPGWGEVLLRGERSIIEDLRRHDCTKRCLGFMTQFSALACWSEPVFSSANELLGVVSLYLDHTGVPDRADQTLLLQASHLSAIASERRRIEQQMFRQACYDNLTGLPNRRLFIDRLHEEIVRAERGGYKLALLFIDLDRFKEVNDTLGHAVGDCLLMEAAQRIRGRVRESDTVARLAGDEFVAILPQAGDSKALVRIAQSLVSALADSFHFGDQAVFVSASIGIAVYPQDASHADALLGCADQAMYAAKENGRNAYSFFTSRMLEQAQHRQQLAGDLREALDKGQLEVFYQPIIDAASGKAQKAEALLRWRHPELGMVPPDRFIPIAEETDLIQDIGAWVFCRAAETAMRWNALCGDGQVRQISVNVSPRQVVRGNPGKVFIEHIDALGLDPTAMVIEITEGLLLDDQADVHKKLQCFHDAGLQLALDDFGTGYSAMAYLKKFNIDYLKIDKSFICDLETDPSDRAIAEAIVAMAHRLGLKVIAEGVETQGQCDLLAAAGCEYVQGYLFAKPMPLEAFLTYVEQSAGDARRGETL